jgi:6-phosphogluconolactonase
MLRLTRQAALRFAIVFIICAFGSAFANEPKSASGGSFVYVISNNLDTTPGVQNTVVAFRRDRTNGLLTSLGVFPTGGKGGRIAAVAASQNALVTDGEFLYAVNPGSNTISAFEIEADGRLKLVGAPVPSGGVFPIALALKKGLLYVGNANSPNYTGFTVKDGVLTALPNSTVTLQKGDQSADLLFNSAGDLLIGTRGSGGAIDAFRVSAKGLLTRAAEVRDQAGVVGAAFNPAFPQVLVATLSDAPAVSSFLVSPQGQLKAVDKVVTQALVDPCWVVFSRDGLTAWAANFYTSTISQFSVGSNGKIALQGVYSSADIGYGSSDLALDSSGQYLYQLLDVTPKINILKVTGEATNGGLRSVGVVGLPALSAPLGLVVVDP